MNDYAGIVDLYDAYVTDTRDLGFWRWCGTPGRARSWS